MRWRSGLVTAPLRGVVSKVRGFLEALELPAGDMLTSSSGCYRLVLPSDTTVDVELAEGSLAARVEETRP